MKKINVKKRIRILSWTSLIGLLFFISTSIYNSIIYVQNLEQVKNIVTLLNKNTSPKLKEEVLNTLTSHIEQTQIVLLITYIFGIVFVSLVVYLGISIKKEISHRIHAMDWIIED